MSFFYLIESRVNHTKVTSVIPKLFQPVKISEVSEGIGICFTLDIDEKEENINVNNDEVFESSPSKSIDSDESASRKFLLYYILIKFFKY